MEEKQYEQHSVTKSILLHLIPGVPVIAGLFIFALPVFSRILGIAVELHVVVGLTLSILITIVPIQLGILLYEGKKLNGKLSLKGVIGYTEKSSIKDYMIYIPILLVYSILLFAVVSPIITPAITDTLFAWYPQEYNLQTAMANPEVLSGYQGVYLLLAMFIITNGIWDHLLRSYIFGVIYFHAWTVTLKNGLLFLMWSFFRYITTFLRGITSHE